MGHGGARAGAGNKGNNKKADPRTAAAPQVRLSGAELTILTAYMEQHSRGRKISTVIRELALAAARNSIS